MTVSPVKIIVSNRGGDEAIINNLAAGAIDDGGRHRINVMTCGEQLDGETRNRKGKRRGRNRRQWRKEVMGAACLVIGGQRRESISNDGARRDNGREAPP